MLSCMKPPRLAPPHPIGLGLENTFPPRPARMPPPLPIGPPCPPPNGPPPNGPGRPPIVSTTPLPLSPAARGGADAPGGELRGGQLRLHPPPQAPRGVLPLHVRRPTAPRTMVQREGEGWGTRTLQSSPGGIDDPSRTIQPGWPGPPAPPYALLDPPAPHITGAVRRWWPHRRRRRHPPPVPTSVDR